MKTQIQIARTSWLLVVLVIGLQSCGSYKTPVLNHWEEANHNGIVHSKDCPVMCKERSVFFEEHAFDAEATTCAYCGQKQQVQMTAQK